MNLPGKKSLCKAFAIAAAAVTMTGCAVLPMDPYYPAPVVILPAPVVVPGPVIYGPVYGPVYRPYHPPHHHHRGHDRHHHHGHRR
jgi:hypothetical protein